MFNEIETRKETHKNQFQTLKAVNNSSHEKCSNVILVSDEKKKNSCFFLLFFLYILANISLNTYTHTHKHTNRTMYSSRDQSHVHHFSHSVNEFSILNFIIFPLNQPFVMYMGIARRTKVWQAHNYILDYIINALTNENDEDDGNEKRSGYNQ